MVIFGGAAYCFFAAGAATARALMLGIFAEASSAAGGSAGVRATASSATVAATTSPTATSVAAVNIVSYRREIMKGS